MSQKNIFITGISSGIGFATADFFLKRGDRVIGTVRKSSDAEYFHATYPDSFISLVVDLADLKQTAEVGQRLAQLGIDRIDVLVNNAGIATAAPFEYQDFLEIQGILNLNVSSLILITQKLLPFLKKSLNARIINISSISGVNGTPFLAAYCASKHAIEGLSESLRRELNIYGIKVIIIGPGSIRTPIWQKGFAKIATKYSETEYEKSFQKFIDFASNEEQNGLHVEAVVDCIVDAADNSEPAIRYAPVPRKWMNWYLARLLPRTYFDKITCKVLGLFKEA